MDWRKAAIEDLKMYRRRKDSLTNLKDRIAALREQYLSVKCSMGADVTPIKGGGGSRIEDRILNNIVERERLTHTYKATKRLVELTERGLSGLGERDQLVLDHFYIHPVKGHVDRLMNELGYERRQIYRIRDSALYDFTISMYGLADY